MKVKKNLFFKKNCYLRLDNPRLTLDKKNNTFKFFEYERTQKILNFFI